MHRPHASTFLLVTTLLSLLLPGAVAASDWYAAPNGLTPSQGGTGHIDHPWDLTTALAGGQQSIHAGDTLWLRGGVYHGTFSSSLAGSSAQAIVVRQYPGERATIDGGAGGPSILFVGGSYTWFRDFEITSSYSDRTDGKRGWGVVIQQDTGSHPGLKFIDLVIHDTAGNGIWVPATDAEVNGCVIYYNGWVVPNPGAPGGYDGHGHGIYAQNQTGTMRFVDNIIFEQFSKGFNLYAQQPVLNDLDVEGNTIFQNGYLVAPDGNNIEIGGAQTAQNPIFRNNYSYYSSMGKDDLGFDPSSGTANMIYEDNYAASGNDWPIWLQGATNPTLRGNTFRGHYGGFDDQTLCRNGLNACYLGSPPPAAPNAIFVRPNQYEPGRANITIYNWSHAATVDADVSGVLQVGDAYEVRNAANFFGPPVLAGTFDGSPLHLPMSGLAVAAPVGWAAPAASGPEFNAFVLRRTGGCGVAPDPHFSVTPQSPAAGQTVQLTDTSLNSPTSWSWSFGDPASGAANTSTLKNPTHVYATAGHYVVFLTVTNASGSATTNNGFDVH